MSHTVYLGLGSNLNDPLQQLNTATAAIAALANVTILAASPNYQNLPLDGSVQPDYVNKVLAIATTSSPVDLLLSLQAIEVKQGRPREHARMAARTIDIDILLYDDRVIDTPALTIPHPGLTSRVFVVLPLLTIAPTLRLPNGHLLAEYSQQFSKDSLHELP